MKCTLVIVSDSKDKKSFEFDKKEITIGRITGNDLVLDDMSISRTHAKIVEKEEQFEIIDLESKNGIKCNGEKVKSAILGNGDKIEIGNVSIEFNCEVPTAEQTLCLKEEVSGKDETLISNEQTVCLKEKAGGEDETIISNECKGVSHILKLVITSGEEAGKEYLINKVGLTIGRSEGNDVVLNDTLVSRHHAQIIRNDDDTITIKDLGSGNGTFINGKKIDETLLSSGDEIKIAEITFTYTVQGENASFENRGKEVKHEIPEQKKISRPVLIGAVLILAVLIVLFLITGKKGEKDVQQESDIVNPQAKTHIKEGKDMLENQNYKEAINKFQMALKIDVENKEAKWLIEEANNNLKKNSRSKQNGSSISDAIDEYVEGRAYEAMSILRGIYKASPDKKQAGQAHAYIGYIEETIKSFQTGTGLYSEKNFDGAFDEWKKTLIFEKELQLTRKSWYAGKIAHVAADKLYRKGLDSSAIGNEEEAVISWKKAVGIAPDHKESLLKLEDAARDLYLEGESQEKTNLEAALQKWKEILTIVPPGNEHYDKAKAKLNLYQ